MIKRLCLPLAVILLAALPLLTLSSCGIIIPRDPNAESEKPEITAPPTVTDAPEETEASRTDAVSRPEVRPVVTADNSAISGKYLAALPDWDFGGIAINIASTDSATFAPSDVSNTVYNARIERNRLVEDKYNTKVLSEAADPEKLFADLSRAVAADDYYCDIIGLPQSEVGRFQAAGLLMNMLSLPFTDYDAPYYNKKAMEQLTAGHAVYGAVGDFNENMDYLYGLFFNRDMARDLGFDPYALVYDGAWDWDAFRRMAKAATSIDGGAVAGHGAAVDINTYESILFASSGVDLVRCGYGRVPALGYGASSAGESEADRMVKVIKKLIKDDATVFTENGNYSSDGAMNAFVGGELLFYTDRLYFTSWIADMKDNWGLLPYPDGGGGFNTYADTAQPVVCVPAGSANSEYTGLFLQAANAASYGWLDDVYYENLQINIVRDSDTLNMLDRIRDGVSYSFAYMFGQQYDYLAHYTYGALYDAVGGGASMSAYYEAGSGDVHDAFAKIFTMLNQ